MRFTRRLILALMAMLLALSLVCMPVLASENKTDTSEPDAPPPGGAGVQPGEDAETVILDEDTEEEPQSNFYGTLWAILPPVIAIALALITKEVYSSLFIGILAGALLYANFNPVITVTSIFSVMGSKIGDSWNVGIIIFLVMLGIIVSLMNKAGGSSAYGRWASRAIKTRRGALLSTFGLGALIFIDDYFNCLTVGSVMLPVTDKHKISRAKLAYIIDATAAPICIIAPISSWAAAVSSSAEGINGFEMFIRAIPYNFYALLTIVMIIAMAYMSFDYGPMKKHELNAIENDDLYTTSERPYAEMESIQASPKGKVFDLIIPIASLIICCIIGMIYTGGFFEGAGFIQAFEDCDASAGLVMGSFIALIITFLLYIPRRIISFKEFADSIISGFRAMVPAIVILVFAWTLSGLCCDGLGVGEYVGGIVKGNAAASFIMPAIMFLIALGLAFSTGTSWGTFAILLPIVINIFTVDGVPVVTEMMVISVSAILAGAVCGDHISPISDTTIMASTGAQCYHINHVSTQLPYALTVAAVSFVCYILASLIQNAWIVLPISIVLMLLTLFVIKILSNKKAA